MFVYTVPYSVLSTFWWIPGLQFLVYLSTLRCLVTNSYKIEWQELPFVSLALLYSTYPHPIDQLAMLHIRVTEISIDNVLRMLLSSDIYIYVYIIAYILSWIKRRVRQFFFVLLSYLFYFWTPCFLLINYLFLSACVTRQFLSLSVYLNGNLNGCNTFAIR